MGIEIFLDQKKTPKERISELSKELSPRNFCKNYVAEMTQNGVATLMTREEFDTYVSNNEFADGPYTDGFGSGYGEPYNPQVQAYGQLKDGKVIYCELDESKREETAELLTLIGKK